MQLQEYDVKKSRLICSGTKMLQSILSFFYCECSTWVTPNVFAHSPGFFNGGCALLAADHFLYIDYLSS